MKLIKTRKINEILLENLYKYKITFLSSKLGFRKNNSN